MRITRLTIEKFTAFEDATFECASGVNVLIGENGTGKSHVLKLLYALHEAARLASRSPKGSLPMRRINSFFSLKEAVEVLLAQVFLPDDDQLGRLVRRARGKRQANLVLEWDAAKLEVSLSSLGRVAVKATGDLHGLKRAVFIPTREVLSIFPGFISDWQERVSAFDRTYHDICVALDMKPLRAPRDEDRSALLRPIERALGGSVALKNGRFYIRLPDGDLEAPLVAEGLRKLAMIAYLIVNGTLTKNAFMFWDEPEASLNPKLARLTSDVAFGLTDAGLQLFLATHDYALASELSLISEKRLRPGAKESAYFALSRTPKSPGVTVERARLLTALQYNPILEALASLHDRELAQTAESLTESVRDDH